MLEIRKMLVGTVELGSLFVGRQAQQVPQTLLQRLEISLSILEAKSLFEIQSPGRPLPGLRRAIS